MNGSAVVMMIVVCGLVWGGFVALLARAVRKEGAKQSWANRRASTPPFTLGLRGAESWNDAERGGCTCS